MSGYKVKRTVYKLSFTDDEYDGIVVRVRAMSMGDRIHVAFDLPWAPEDTVDERRAKQRELHEMFVDHLVEWNLEEEDAEDTPVPQTIEGLLSLEAEFIGLLVGVWQAGRAAVPGPLGPSSSGGELSPVESTLTEIPFENLAS